MQSGVRPDIARWDAIIGEQAVAIDTGATDIVVATVSPIQPIPFTPFSPSFSQFEGYEELGRMPIIQSPG
jgi:hypothetical protein